MYIPYSRNTTVNSTINFTLKRHSVSMWLENTILYAVCRCDGDSFGEIKLRVNETTFRVFNLIKMFESILIKERHRKYLTVKP